MAAENGAPEAADASADVDVAIRDSHMELRASAFRLDLNFCTTVANQDKQR